MLRTARRLDLALAGHELTRAELRWPDLGGVDLAGREVLEVRSYGKQILTRLSGGSGAPRRIATVTAEPLTLRSHLRMEGRWTVVPGGPRGWPAAGGVSVRAVLGVPDWTAIGTWLGLLDLVPTAQEDGLIGHLGPDILADDFPTVGLTESLRRLARQPARHVGDALLDQRNLAGIGTMYMAETLFLQAVSPWESAGEVDLPTVLQRARRLMVRGATQAQQNTTGDPRRGQDMFVHGRSGRPCRRCGGSIRVAMIGEATRERTAFYCPTCQPGPTPTDDGRPQQPLGTAPRRSVPGSTRTPAAYRPARARRG